MLALESFIAVLLMRLHYQPIIESVVAQSMHMSQINQENQNRHLTRNVNGEW
jgi:hypothetical protein